MTQQNQAVTYTKAIGIILMVLAHCSHFPLLYQIVYSFHMPLFFIMSGYCFKTKYFHEPVSFVWKRIKGLWWPYVKWGLLFLAFHNVFCHLNIYGKLCGQSLYTTGEYLHKMSCIVFQMFNAEPMPGGFWFLRALFFGSLIAYCVLFMGNLFSKWLKCSYLITCTVGGVILIVSCITINYLHKTYTVLYISPIDFCAATFFVVGHCLAQRKAPLFKPKQSVLAFGLLILNSFYNLISLAQGPFYETTRIIPYIITAILGTWCIYSFPWQRLKGLPSKLMRYIGDHTLVILTWHFLCFKLVSLIIIEVYGLPIERLAEIPTIGEYDNRGWFVLSTLFGVGIPLAICYSFDSLIKYGKNKIS